MKNQNEYNGWTNYATWRVQLEIFDSMHVEDYFDEFPDVDDLKDYVENVVFENYHGTLGLVEDYARVFLSEVNYHEILQEMKEVYEHEKNL
tara:strand:+ start:3331 stop:3603 length:273 start_codon:yes stop_codon:yes gene_type:complete